MQKAIYFMPDISGFTKFVNSTEFEHGIHIISELLELLIDNATNDLQLAEIEGDSLFMFTSEIPDYQQLIAQTTKMLDAFHKHTSSYENKRICNCGSCRTTTNLELKFLVHYGDLAFIKVKDFVKPYGSDVIKIHRLLKNNVPVNEYVLFTNAAFNLYKDQLDETWIKKSSSFDFGNINYFYKNLESLIELKQAQVDYTEKENFEEAIPVLKLENTFDANIHAIHTYLSELKYRHLWDKGVKRIDFDSHKVNRVGTQHNCVISFQNFKFETLSSNSVDALMYGETTKDMMFVKNYSYLIRLNEIDDNTTNVELSVFLNFTTLGTLMRNNIRNILTKIWKNKLKNLNKLSKTNPVTIN
jgi:hypothetical protein